MMILEMNEVILEFNRNGRPVRFPGVGIFTPSIRRNGQLSVRFRADAGLIRKLNSKNFFRGEIINTENIDADNARLKELWALCDLSRITGVGAVFARVVYEAGIHSVSEFAETQASSHYLKYMSVIEKFGYSAGHFSEGDIQFCIDYARVVNESDQPSLAG